MTFGGVTRDPTTALRSGIAITAGIALLSTGCAASPPRLGEGFAGASNPNGVVYGLNAVRAGETLWLGLPALVVSAREPFRVRDAQLVPRTSTVEITGIFVMSLRASRQRHVTILEDRYFNAYGFRPVSSAAAFWFQPGESDHYVLIKLKVDQANSFRLSGVQLQFEGRSGEREHQQIGIGVQVGGAT